MTSDRVTSALADRIVAAAALTFGLPPVAPLRHTADRLSDLSRALKDSLAPGRAARSRMRSVAVASATSSGDDPWE